MFKCAICSSEYEKACSLGTHLWKTHKLKPKEYYDRYLRRDGEGVCAECGHPTRFKSIGIGYMEFCCRKCSAEYIANDAMRRQHKIDKRNETIARLMAEGAEQYLKESADKRKQTMKERYGVEYYSQTKEFGEKYRATSMERFGATSYLGSDEGQANMRRHNMETIGVPYRFCLNRENAVSYYCDLLKKHDCELVAFSDKKHIAYKCNKCGETSMEQDLFIKMRDSKGVTPCVHCEAKLPHDSFEERTIRAFIETVLHVKCDHYDRNFLGPYGADIVCEEQKVIVEYDGLHWHNAAYVEPEYHILKTSIAESMGYHLIHVFSDEWRDKPDIVQSRLSNILHVPVAGKSRKIYARKCDICMVSDDESHKFLEENHIQGYVPASCRIGLKYDDELVALMTFGKSRFAKDEYELLRFCTKTYNSVVGGAARLLSYYMAHFHHGEKLVSYADRRWSSGDAFYGKIGFTKISDGEIGYSYVIDGHRESRLNYQKHKLVAGGADASMTEEEIMAERGYYRIYDCGNYKFQYIEKDTH